MILETRPEASGQSPSNEASGRALAGEFVLRKGPAERLDALDTLAESLAYLVRVRNRLTALELRPEIETAAEWFLDNEHLIARALRQVREDMPRGFYKRLPALENGSPRACAIASHFLEQSELVLDEIGLVQFVQGAQAHSPFAIAELWALPTALRLVVWDVLVSTLTELSGIAPPCKPSVELGTALRGLSGEERMARSVRALRAVESIRWERVFRATSRVEELLRGDPAGAYARMEAASRDRYRGVVEEDRVEHREH